MKRPIVASGRRADSRAPSTGEDTELIAALSNPDFYPHHPAQVEVRETHISRVFLAGELAYKLKKPLVLPFLDYGTPQRRRHMCREEVRLNRRLAEDIYLGVRSVASGDDGLHLAAEDDPQAIDYLVWMRRYDERATLARKLTDGGAEKALLESIDSLARLLVPFHERARTVAGEGAGERAVRGRVEENIRELLGLLGGSSAASERVRTLERFTGAFLAGHAAELDGRAQGGRVVEGHGDLRAEHVLLDGPVRVLDCIEFDPRRRELDVADELAFLAMDLTMRGAESLARRLIDAYRDAGGDPGNEALVAFYACFRALVRAKVALLRVAQLEAPDAERRRQSAAAEELLALAERFAWRARLAPVIAICGAPASGKSTLAEALSQVSGLPHLSSDEVRKEAAGLSPQQRAPLALYGPQANRRTYAALGRLAADEATRRGGHGGAIVDATFRHGEDRAAFLEAFTGRAPLLFVECTAPLEVRLERARHREAEPGRVSDASEAVVLDERHSWEPLSAISPAKRTILDTDRPLDGQLADLAAWLDRRLGAGTPESAG